MMRANDLALEQSPDAFDAVGVQNIVADIFASAVINAVMIVVAPQTEKCAMFMVITAGPSATLARITVWTLLAER